MSKKAKGARARRQSTLTSLANKGALGDETTRLVLLLAAAHWWRYWAAINSPHLLQPSASSICRERIDDPSVWARAEAKQLNLIDLAQRGRMLRAGAANFALVLDLIVVDDLTIEQAAIKRFGVENRLNKERIRYGLREALDWVACIKHLWGT